MYINSDLLNKEVIISKFKGKPTDKYKEYIYLICINLTGKMNNLYRNSKDDHYDFLMTSYLDGLNIYKKIKNTDSSFVYISEIMKRSYIKGYNLQKFGKTYLREGEKDTVIINIDL